jgi:signal transduction histidine kinase
MAFILIALYMIFVSQRRLLRLSRMQEAILSSVTHELKTPIASIRLYAETLLLRNVTEQDRLKFLKRTLSEADRLQSLIDTVLISARLQSEKTAVNLTRVDLKEIILTCYNKAKERFSDTRYFEILFIGLNSTEAMIVLGNPYHLSTLFDNLLDNAVKYTNKNGKIKLEVNLKKDSIVVSVIDDGCGIERENLKKIFKKFFRITNKNQNIVKGSGLGLSVCRSIIDEHNGKIAAFSEGLNKGATFYVELKRLHSHN